MRSLGLQIAEKELKVSTLEGDLRIEREMRQALENSVVKDKEKISDLNMELQRLQIVGLVSNEQRSLPSIIQKSCRIFSSSD